MDLDCKFVLNVNNNYVCTVEDAVINDPETNTNFEGTHEQYYCKGNVEILRFYHGVVKFCPDNLYLSFPNLKTLTMSQCGLQSITADDLFELINLEILDLSGNELTWLPNDLLENKTELRKVNFSCNFLNRMSSQVLEPLKEILEEADFRGNPLINVRYIHGNDLDAFLQSLDNHPPQPDDPKQISRRHKPHVDKEEEFFESGDFSDFIIKVRGEEHKVHKFILAAQSPVFERMFKNEDLEGEQTLKNASNISEGAFEDFLRYFYNGGVIKNEDNAMELFELAIEFEVAKLKSECEEIILKMLNESNVIEVYNIGHHHGSDTLKQAAFDVIQEIAPGIADECIDEEEDLNKLIAAKREFDNVLQRLKKCE